MKKTFLHKSFCLILAAVVLVLSLQAGLLSARADSLPSEVDYSITKLQHYYNQRNAEEVSSVFEPQVYESCLALARMMGVDPALIDSGLPFLSAVFPVRPVQTTNELPNCKMSHLDYTGDDDAGTVSLTCTMSYDDGTKEIFSSTIRLRRSGELMLITDMPESVRTAQEDGSGDQTQPVEPQPYPGNPPGETDPEEGDAGNEDPGDNSGSPEPEPGDEEDPGSEEDSGEEEDPGEDEIGGTVYEEELEEHGGYTPVRLHGLWGILSEDRYPVVECQYREIKYVCDTYWLVRSDTGWGIINPATGNVTECKYSDFGTASNGLIPACYETLWGIITLDGDISVDFKYTKMSREIIHDLVTVKVNSSDGVIDTHGNPVLPVSPDTDDPEILSNGLVYAYMKKFTDDGNAYVVFDRTGKALEHSSMKHSFTTLTDDLVLVSTDRNNPKRRQVVLDSNGNVTLDLLDTMTKLIGEELLWCAVYPDYADGEWMPIAIKRKPSSSSSYSADSLLCNYTNLSGRLKYTRFIESSSFKPQEQISVNGITKVYVTNRKLTILNNETVYEIDGKDIDYYLLGDNMVAFQTDSSTKFFVFDIGESKKTELAKRYNPRKITPNNFSLIVTDGTYYGLVTGKGLIGEGIQYLDVSVDSTSGSMKFGTETFEIRIDEEDGSVYRYEGEDETILNASPLPGGEAVTGIPFQLNNQQDIPVVTSPPDSNTPAEPGEGNNPPGNTQPVPGPGNGNNNASGSYLASTAIDNVNVRKMPDKKSDLISRLEEKGTPVTVTGEAYDEANQKWFHVELRNGKQGYVQSHLIGEYDPTFDERHKETPEPEITAPPEDEPAQPPETEEPAEPAEPEEPEEPEEPPADDHTGESVFPTTGKTNIDQVNIRAKPSYKGKRITAITHAGTAVKVNAIVDDGEGSSWYKIDVGRISGYVLSTTVTLDNENPDSASRFPFQAQTRIKKVNLRAKADPKSKRITYIQKKGTVVTILGEVTGKDGKPWYHVKLSNNETGYSQSSYFIPLGSEP